MQRFVHQRSLGDFQRQIHRARVGQQSLAVHLTANYQLCAGGSGEQGSNLQTGHHTGGIGVQQHVLHAFGVRVVQCAHHPAGYRGHGAEQLLQLGAVAAAQLNQSVGVIHQ